MQRGSGSQKKTQSILLLCILPFAAYGLLLLAKTLYARFAEPYLPPCVLRTLTGLQCPGCGMTHSVYALAALDIPTALRENAAVPFALLLGIARYAEAWLNVLGHPMQLIPRRKAFLYGCFAVFLLYFLLRNL